MSQALRETGRKLDLASASRHERGDAALIGYPIEAIWTYAVNTGFGHNEIQRNVVRLRIDAGHARQLEPDSDLERLGLHGGQGSVVSQPTNKGVAML